MESVIVGVIVALATLGVARHLIKSIRRADGTGGGCHGGCTGCRFRDAGALRPGAFQDRASCDIEIRNEPRGR